jgi:hypothetical protein
MPEYPCRHRTGLFKVPSGTIPADTEQAPLRIHAGVFLQTQIRTESAGLGRNVNPWPPKHEPVKSDVHFVIKSSSSVFTLSIFVHQHFLTFTAAYLFSPPPEMEITQSD